MLVDGENPLFEYELNIIRVVSYLELGEKASYVVVLVYPEVML
jgi:hypothetical protein